MRQTTRASASAASTMEDTTRARILRAAFDVFAARGFEGATTREIAQRADANLGLIPYYFGDKESLWREAVDHVFGDLAAQALTQLPAVRRVRSTPAEDRAVVERLLRGYVAFLMQRPAFVQLMYDESRRDSDRMRWVVDHHVRPLAERIWPVLQRAQRSGVLPDVPLASLHYIVLGAAGTFFSHAPECRRLLGADPFDARTAAAHADALVRVLLGPER